MNILASRISDIIDFRYSYDDIVIEYDNTIEAIKKIQDYKVKFKKEISIDASDISPDEVRVWLKQLPVQPINVNIYWVSFKEGITLSYDVFIRYYDDLWFPSSDDTWIIDENYNWLIELNHEEIMSFWIR